MMEWSCFCAVKFLWFFLFMFLTLAMYTFLGIVLMALAPSAPAASVSSVTLLAAWALFAGMGFLIPFSPQTRIMHFLSVPSLKGQPASWCPWLGLYCS